MNIAEALRLLADEEDAKWACNRRAIKAAVTFIPWPEYFARRPVTPEVRRRIERLNPNGYQEGMWPRGYRRSRQLTRDFSRDIIGPKRFIEKNGREAYRAARHLFRNEGHQKYITGMACLEHGYRG